jgi:hypothetical protein
MTKLLWTASRLAGCATLASLALGCSRPARVEKAAIDLGESNRLRRPVASQSPDSNWSTRVPEPDQPHSPEPEPQPDIEPNGRPETGRDDEREADSEGAQSGENTEVNDGAAELGRESEQTRAPDVKPAFPGRQSRKPGMTPSAAAEAARRSLAIARAAVKRGDPTSASREALTAYELASQHFKTDASCAEIVADANRLLEAIGRRQRPQDVPTRFE